VLDSAVCITDGFLSRGKCDSSTCLIRPILKKRAYLHFDKPRLQEVFLQKLAQFSQGKNVLDVA
jgi:hypothetical protein